MLSLVLLQLECRRLARAPLRSSMVLRAAASMDEEKCCRRWRHAQLTPMYGLVRHNLHEQVAAATFVACERLIVGGLDFPVPAITSHQGPATGGSHTLCEAFHVVP